MNFAYIYKLLNKKQDITSFKTIFNQSIIGSGNVSGYVQIPYDFAFSVFGKPTASEQVFRFVTCRSFIIGVDSLGAVRSAAPANANAVFTVAKNSENIGTITFSAGSNVGTISINGTQFVFGDRLTVTAPSSQDSALTDIDFSLLAVTDGEVGQIPN
jgi:hypothetical protein